MKMTKTEQTISYFADKISQCNNLSLQLASDDRKDEAVFAKVQMNVYDIFSTVFSAAVKAAGQDDQKVVQFFADRIQQIPQSWHIALANAEKFNQTEKAHIERVKLDTATEIKAAFEDIWEGAI